MACIAGKIGRGLYRNSQAEYGSDTGFTAYNYYAQESLSGSACFVVDFNTYGGTMISDDYIEVDTTKWYQHGVSVKTIQRSYNNRLGSGHLGFVCYDKDRQFIDTRNCGGIGNTFLSRQANPGDTVIYIQSNSDWHTGSTAVWRYVNFFPATHPEWNIPHTYTRFTNYQYNENGITLTAENDYEVQLTSALPNLGYPLPAGTPVSNAQAGGTFNYAHGAPDYSESWTTYITPPFTGESRNSTFPFRFATKYIRFNNLLNYNYRNETSGNSARYLIDNIFLIQLPDNNPRNGIFTTAKTGIRSV
jgi:hypothetical protein